MPRKTVALSLFWRTFFLLALLLVGGVFAWVQTFRALEFEPRAVQAAQQIASLVNLSRAALQASDDINRVTLIKSMSNQESVRLAPREPGDKWEPFEVDRFSQAIAARAARAARARHAWSPARSTAAGPVGRLLDREGPVLAAGRRRRASRPIAGSTLVAVGRHRAARHGARLGRDRAR